MSEVTLELVQARQAELAQLIEQLKREPVKLARLSGPAIDIALQAGDHYAGVVLDEQGQIKHHLVLMAAKPQRQARLADRDGLGELRRRRAAHAPGAGAALCQLQASPRT